jgi:hypothetical protein
LKVQFRLIHLPKAGDESSQISRRRNSQGELKRSNYADRSQRDKDNGIDSRFRRIADPIAGWR